MPSKPKGSGKQQKQQQKQQEEEREEVFEQGEAVLARDSGELYDAKVRWR
jgi:hypothetical protein